ncbi:hypothetical protein [Spirochaeta isovalerica]|uniref:Uncharacterized protein n=1 Tax=Spirochaeta isovalerica TaxID=150 RepID=A0A841RCB1_9SPIO|nr:hypothetical protein [Spirochaeta isovalerica]MBB6481583.1 hypothetical protein [Spirochaeta isovalerica]
MEKYSDELLEQIEVLKEKAEENRLQKSLGNLSRQFNAWKKKNLDSRTLASHIKEWYFINMEGGKYTSGSDPGMPIAKALTDGYLKESDISPELLSRLEILIEILKV